MHSILQRRHFHKCRFVGGGKIERRDDGVRPGRGRSRCRILPFPGSHGNAGRPIVRLIAPRYSSVGAAQGFLHAACVVEEFP